MSTSFQKYTSTSMGRTVLISSLIVLVLGYLAFLLPLAPADSQSWLYMDVNLPPEERFNIWLVIFEALLLSAIFFFLTIALAGYTQLQNQLPSWNQLMLSGGLVLVMAWLVPQISVGEASLAGGSGSGFNHFTPDMQLWTFIGTVVGILLFSLYLYYTGPAEEQ